MKAGRVITRTVAVALIWTGFMVGIATVPLNGARIGALLLIAAGGVLLVQVARVRAS